MLNPLETLKSYREILNFNRKFQSNEILNKILNNLCEKRESKKPIFLQIDDSFNAENLNLFVQIEEITANDLRISIFIKQSQENEKNKTYAQLLINQIINNIIE